MSDRPAFAAYLNQMAVHRDLTGDFDSIIRHRINSGEMAKEQRPVVCVPADEKLRAAFDAAVKESIAQEPKG